MKIKKNNTSIIISVVFFLLLLSSCPADAGSNVLSALIKKNKNKEVVSVIDWDAGNNHSLLCVVTADSSQKQIIGPIMTLTMYNKYKGNKIKKIFEYTPPDFFISGYPISESGGRFFTFWSTASAYSFYVFALVDNKIVTVLETGSQLMPEFAWDKDGNEIILISGLEWIKDDKSGEDIQVQSDTDIYRWNKNKYDKVATVPWRERFEYLKKIAD